MYAIRSYYETFILSNFNPEYFMAKTKAKASTGAKRPARSRKYVYFFGGKKAEGKADMKNLLV